MIRQRPNDGPRLAAMIAFCLPGNQPDSLRALSFGFTPYEPGKVGHIFIRSHFFKQPSEADLELIKDLEAELYAQTPDHFTYEFDVQVAPIGTKLALLPHTAWIDGAEAYRPR